MTVETFFEKFELFADAPDAVGKMRELILNVACSGRLVPQDANDEPASELVKKIDRSISGMRAKKHSPVEPIDSDSMPPIPASWSWVRLGNVAEYGSRDKVDSSKIKPDDWLLDLEDIEKDTSRLLQRKSFKDSPSLSTKTKFVAGDVLYGKLRPYLNKVLVADASGYCTTEIIPIRTHGFIDPNYLCYGLKRSHFIEYAVSKCYGMNLPRLGTDDARLAPFPLPPLAEQKRIVAKVDELMGLCDRLEAQQQEQEQKHAALSRAALARFAEAPTPANLEYLFHQSYTIDPADLRKSILTMAVQGKLVEVDPNEEPIHQTCPEFTGTIADGLPSNWRLAKYRDLTVAVTSGSRGWKEFYAKTGAYFIRTQNIKTDRLLFDDMAYVDLPERERLPRAQVRAGDILITITGANVTKAARVEVQPPEAYVSQHIALTRPRWPEMAPFLHLCFISPGAARGELEKLAYGDKPGLNLNNIRDLVLPVPPLGEQKRIVAKVEALMALVDRLEAQQREAAALATRLLDAALAELTQSTPTGG